jgi:hypothetical protein
LRTERVIVQQNRIHTQHFGMNSDRKFIKKILRANYGLRVKTSSCGSVPKTGIES